MKYLRLSKILEDVQPHEEIPFKRLIFNGGEKHIKLLSSVGAEVTIEAQLKDSDSIMELFMATDALRRVGAENIDLLAPYIPYGRQDRVMVRGEPLSIKVFVDILNTQNYETVYTLNNHSPVTTALINNCMEINENRILDSFLGKLTNTLLISPDAGAVKKTEKIAKDFQMAVSYASKIRDVGTGEIMEIHVDGRSVCGKNCFIIDDICDGGKTFVMLSQALKKRGCGRISLYVSHGIFSRGVDILRKTINEIFTTNDFRLLDRGRGVIITKLRKEDLK